MIKTAFWRNFLLDYLLRLERRSFAGSESAGGLLGILMSESDVSASEALGLPALAGCVEFIANSVAAFPIKLYRRANGEIEEVEDDPRVRMLNGDTGDLLNGWQWKKALTRDYLLYGAGYSFIEWSGNEVKGLYYVENKQVSITPGLDPIYKIAEIRVNGRPYRELDFIKVTRNSKNGVAGIGVLDENKKAIALAYALLTYEDTLIRSGGNKRGFLSAEKRLSAEAIAELREQYKKMYSNASTGTMVLNEGIKFSEASSTSVELQLSQMIQGVDLGIHRLFNLSPQVVAGNAKDEEHIEAVKKAVLPVVDAFSAALNKDLLLDKEKGVFYFAFDTKDSLKADVYKRFQAWKLAVESNIMQIDEVRKEENLPPLGVNFVTLNLRDVLYDPKTNMFFVPNTGRSSRIGQEEPALEPPPQESVSREPIEGSEDDGDRDQE